MLINVTLGHLVYDFGTVKNRGTEKIEPNRTGTEKGTETGTVPPLVLTRARMPFTVLHLLCFIPSAFIPLLQLFHLQCWLRVLHGETLQEEKVAQGCENYRVIIPRNLAPPSPRPTNTYAPRRRRTFPIRRFYAKPPLKERERARGRARHHISKAWQ